MDEPMKTVELPNIEGRQTFLVEVQERCGENLELCYQCLKCTVGCPTAPHMDFNPNTIVRMIQFGLRREVLESNAIWLCVSCETCGTRCPNEIDIGLLMDALREMSLEEGCRPKERGIVVLHNAFMESIRRGGRVHEATMLMEYKLRSGDYWTDLIPGMKLFMKGKIPLFPGRIKGIDSIREIYEKTQKKGKVLRNREGKSR
jgi:heterodisulfide reductase subunit C